MKRGVIMNDKLFDNFLRKQICSFTSSDPEFVKNELSEYLSCYPLDYTAYPIYANILITLGHDEEAEKVLDYASKYAYTDKRFVGEEFMMQCFNESVFFTRIKLFIFRGEYDKALKYIDDNKEYFGDTNVTQVKFFCKGKMGMLYKDFKEKKSYLFRQIIDYDYDDFLKHIKKHQVTCEKKTNVVDINTFNIDFPLDEVLLEIKKYIPSEKGLFNGLISDRYTFKYDGCGRANGRIVDYFDVTTLHNTGDIITMYPTSEYRLTTPAVDLSYIKSKSDKTMTRSQIDKFNQRYMKRSLTK